MTKEELRGDGRFYELEMAQMRQYQKEHDALMARTKEMAFDEEGVCPTVTKDMGYHLGWASKMYDSWLKEFRGEKEQRKLLLL